MPPVIRRARKRLGRRGCALAILGLAKIAFGIGYATEPDSSPVGLEVLDRHGGVQNWSSVWLICGVIAFICAWLRIGRDWLGFFIACIPPLVWGSVYLIGAVSGGFPRGFAIAAWYAIGHVCFILWAATVPEYSLPHSRPKKE